MAIAAATAAMTAGCGSSPPAPDASGPSAFTYDVLHRKLAGDVFASSDKKSVLDLGQSLCGALDKGHTVAQLNEGLQATKSLKTTAVDDAKFVTTAVATLCPKYVPQILTTGSPTPTPTH